MPDGIRWQGGAGLFDGVIECVQLLEGELGVLFAGREVGEDPSDADVLVRIGGTQDIECLLGRQP